MRRRKRERHPPTRHRRLTVAAGVIGFGILLAAGLTTAYTDSMTVAPSVVVDSSTTTSVITTP